MGRISGSGAYIVAMLCLACPAAAAAEALVVRSSGPSAKLYPVGRMIAEKAPIKLAAGDIVTMVVANRTRTFRGPGIFAADLSVRTAAAEAPAIGRRRAIGASREDPPAGDGPGLWEADILQSGRICIADPAKLKLWRPESDAAASLTIARAGVAPHTVSWRAGEKRVSWPAAVPMVEGADYQLRLAGGAETSRVSFVRVDAAPDALTGMARRLIDKGCQNQLDVLVDSASEPR